MNCPTCNTPLPIETLRRAVREMGRLTGGQKKRNAGGRPRLPHCACGAMTINRAKARNHKCEEQGQ